MKISEVLLEADIPDSLRNVEIADIFGAKLTAGDVADHVPGLDPKTVIQYGRAINDTIQQKITPGYTVGDAVVDAALMIPAARLAGAVFKGGRAIGAAAAAYGRRQVGQEVAKDVVGNSVKINPEITGAAKNLAGKSGGGSVGSTTAPLQPPKKKARRKVGDTITIPYNGKKYQVPIIEVLPDGYVVSAEPILQKPGAKMTVKDPA
jgi:hypothetical protein